MSGAALLSVRDLKVHFPVRVGGLFGKIIPVKAVDGVSFDLRPGETLGVVGESGCGKSTLGRAILQLIPTTDGAVVWLGERIDSLSRHDMRAKREDMQIIFQDPLASLDPRMTIGDVIAEPLRTFQPKLSRKEVRARVEDMLAKVGLSPHMINRYPHEFSGGQCQRVGVARAMILRPRLIVCDEPVSALDVSIQAQIVNLLMDLQREFHLSLIFISHNLSVVRHISHRILVLYLGRVMELADRDQLYRNPRHPYTQALVSAVPIPDPDLERQKERLVLTGDLPSPLAPPSGCVFRTRCPYATSICAEDVPPLDLIEPGHQAACHWWREIAAGEKGRTGPLGEVTVAADGIHPAPGAAPGRS
jgi:oligopeptide transport system ATP-binding protein